jgi:hypothetical protein
MPRLFPQPPNIGDCRGDLGSFLLSLSERPHSSQPVPAGRSQCSPSGLLFCITPSCSPLFAHTARVTRFCLCELMAAAPPRIGGCGWGHDVIGDNEKPRLLGGRAGLLSRTDDPARKVASSAST